MNDPNSTVILTLLWNIQTTCRTNGPSATYSRIPSLDDVICGNSSGFRLRCRRNRFLFMTEYRTDGRRSVSAGRSSCLLSLSLCLSFLLSDHVCVSLFHRWNLSFFFFSERRNTANRRKEAFSSSQKEIRWKPNGFSCIFRSRLTVSEEFGLNR